ncbi:MAG: sigma-70 family RNA polymerase sigma factor [Pedosphaera sp.]|nr:sigma-70 family RNA polymerase sigma factor [Pedosphaera sp.]
MAETAIPTTDATLMERARQGDATAFGELVERWQQPVISFIYRSLPDATEAEDLAQSVFLQIWKTAARYQATAKFSTFLFTIARNLTLNEIRRRARHPASSLDLPDDGGDLHSPQQIKDSTALSGEQALTRAELMNMVSEAVADLPEKQRTALVLCQDGEVSYEEIAAILGCSVQATKSLIHRGRETLKSRLKPYLHSGEWEHDTATSR